MPRKSFKRQNERRLELIGKKYDGGLTEDETAELAELKTWCSEWIQKRFPREAEPLDEIDKRFDEIKARLKAKMETP